MSATPNIMCDDDHVFDDVRTPDSNPSLASVSDNYASIPEEMKQAHSWCVYKIEPSAEGKPTKVPYNPLTGRKCNDPSRGVSFKDAKAGAKDYSGLGFYVESPYLVIDIDHCIDKEGLVAEYAAEIIREIGSYAEVSPSGTGIHIWAKGEKPGTACRRGIEIYSTKRFLTVTANPIPAMPREVRTVQIAPIYNRMLRGDFVEPQLQQNADTVATSSTRKKSVQVEQSGTALTTKYDLLMRGTVSGDKPTVISDDFGNSLTYPDRSSADMALATVSAMKHGDNPDAIWVDYEGSSLYREGWGKREADFRRLTIAKAIASAQRTKDAATGALKMSSLELEEYKKRIASSLTEQASYTEDIPAFDPTVINGIYAEFVELITRGTTLAPQFAFVIAKTIVGLRMAGKVKFETLDAEPRYYTALIGETGSGKGEAWRRMLKIIQPANALDGCRVKIINSMDSGAGLKDFFFQIPEEQPVLCYVDEVIGLGNKAKATKNPEILDTIIELANSTNVSRTLANRGKERRCKTKSDARLAVVMCGQDGEVYTEAFAGRTRMGLWDRLYPEYSVPVEAGDLPEVPLQDAIMLLSKLNSLDYSGTIAMSDAAKAALENFWQAQMKEVRTKARFRTNLLLDAYMSAFGRGSQTVEPEDAEIAVKIFTRQLVIRRVHFKTEIPDAVGKYISRLKTITEKMAQAIAGGVEPETVAKSRRDFERECHSYRDNEGHIFEKAWNGFSKVYLETISVEGANGRRYPKFIPAAEG